MSFLLNKCHDAGYGSLHVHNPSIQETRQEVRKWKVQRYPKLHSETLSHKTKGWGCSLVVEDMPSMSKTLG
jgi:hypothetical protein